MFSFHLEQTLLPIDNHVTCFPQHEVPASDFLEFRVHGSLSLEEFSDFPLPSPQSRSLSLVTIWPPPTPVQHETQVTVAARGWLSSGHTAASGWSFLPQAQASQGVQPWISLSEAALPVSLREWEPPSCPSSQRGFCGAWLGGDPSSPGSAHTGVCSLSPFHLLAFLFPRVLGGVALLFCVPVSFIIFLSPTLSLLCLWNSTG